VSSPAQLFPVRPRNDRFAPLAVIFRISVFDPKPTADQAGPHSECKLISIKIDQVKVAHAVFVVLRWLYDPGSARRQFGVDGIDIPSEHADAAIAG
jgi:hypothetical protein